jgi:hypothetical protein
VKFPATHRELSTFLNRVKETERVLRQEHDFARKVRHLKTSIQLEPTEQKERRSMKQAAEEEPGVDMNCYFIVSPGKVPVSGLSMPRQGY